MAKNKMAIKGGVIPYVVEDGEVLMMFMVSSSSKYGGELPQIAKGGVEKNETVYAGAFREAEEELGLRERNIVKGSEKLCWSGYFKTTTTDSEMSIYSVQVKDQKDFGKPHFETKYTVWMTLEEFMMGGRDTQKHIVRDAHTSALSWLKLD